MLSQDEPALYNALKWMLYDSYTHFSMGLLSARPSGNQSPISRLALSTASDPWMTLRPTSMQKSPRMLPGSAQPYITSWLHNLPALVSGPSFLMRTSDAVM